MPAPALPISHGRTPLAQTPKEHAMQYLTILLGTFFTLRDSLWVTEDPRLILGTQQLTAQVPIIIPNGQWKEAVGEPVYRKLSEKKIPSEPLEWHTGLEEEVKRMRAPDYVGLSFGKAPEAEAESALDLLEETAVNKLTDEATVHPFDGVAFSSTTARKINPLSDASPTYVTQKNISAGYEGFTAVRKHFWGIKRPNGKGYLNLSPAAIVAGNDAYNSWEDVNTKDEITITVEGGVEKRPSKETNKYRGKFKLYRSPFLGTNDSLVFASGAAAGVPFIVHVLTGQEQLPNGDIRAQQAWEKIMGNPMMPNFKYFGEGDPIVERTGKVQIKGTMAFQVTPMCPWSFLHCKPS